MPRHATLGVDNKLDASQVPTGLGGVTDHGALAGLSDDDHSQYHTDSRGDARYSQLGHTHSIANVTSLQTTLDGKQPLATVLTNTTAAFTTAQETKLAGVATGATANNTDAFLLSRTNHTGTQAASTITGLAKFNQSIAQQGAGFATDTYLTGSYITIPTGGLKVGSRYYCMFNVSKTAAGTTAPVIQLRAGTAGTTADTSRLSFTFPAQTAVIDSGVFEMWVTVRTAGASAVLQGVCRLTHGLSITGLSTSVSPVVLVTSAAFDATVANIGFGLSVNGGASASWTVQLVQAELDNLN